jgi:hypothetical protein
MGVSFFSANLPFASCSEEAPPVVEELTEALLFAGVPCLAANLPCTSLTRDEVAGFKDVDALRVVDFLAELVCEGAEEGSLGANLPLESRSNDLDFISEVEVELVDPRLFLGVMGGSSWKITRLFGEIEEALVIFGVTSISSNSSPV